jgi:hypothetical protein
MSLDKELLDRFEKQLEENRKKYNYNYNLSNSQSVLKSHPACEDCRNNAMNGGSGMCSCMLAGPTIT